MKSAAEINAQLAQKMIDFAPWDAWDTEQPVSVRVEGTRILCSQKNAAALAAKIKKAHRTFPTGAYKRVKCERVFPAFEPGMKTIEYIARFAALNARAHLLPLDLDALGDRAAALYENGALDFDAIEERDFSEQAAQDVAQVLADAVAAVAIDTAQTTARSDELAQVAHTQADTAVDVVADVKELAEVATLAADVVSTKGCTPGHTNTGCATSAHHSSSAPRAARGQIVAGKSGRWSAVLHTTPAKAASKAKARTHHAHRRPPMTTTANTPPPGKAPSAAPGKPPARPATLAPEYTTGAELQTLREAAGLSREALAELVGVQARTVKHWENGRAGVPADVAEQAHTLARWVRLAADRMHTDTREWLRQFDPVQVHHITAPEPRTLTAKPTGPLALVRYQQTADMLPTDQAKGARADCHGAAVAQVVQRLALDGVAARVVWFDAASFTSWRQADHTTDTPAARQAWAECEALPAQAVPARGDQPPNSNHGTP